MMGRTKKVGLAGGLKARYGATVRKRYIEVVTESRRRHRCPQCGALAVRRRSVGIWKCSKCSLKYAGGAYTPSTKLGVTSKRAARGLSEES